ncbi:hypothetical protein G3570_12985 [Balneolaceae bacterium YR4-1]|uniref:Uncharacterized protein n=1 Tax=Halalkalibaculum roseum TaxID=2709311 RepID=A0A6M1T0D5_9BACT|nr:hypothetical protein [Halalkalibaculum roseum]NGP77556.1 hypothetical protein [Halalkalibaculum roseum]
MKIFKTFGLLILLLIGFQLSAIAQGNDATAKFKKYINNVVQKVEKAESPDQKRSILNDSFDNMIDTFDKVSGMKGVSEDNKAAIAKFRSTIVEKKNELNGNNGFAAVKNNQLNNFAHYVQQDLEQADETITISVTVLLLIIIILLLL